MNCSRVLAEPGSSQRFHYGRQRSARRRVSPASAVSEFPAPAAAERNWPRGRRRRTSALRRIFSRAAAWEQAVRHLVAAEDFDGAAHSDRRTRVGMDLFGRAGSLASLADSLPQAALEAHPRALAHRAEVARLRGEYEVAQSLFRRAAACFMTAAGQRRRGRSASFACDAARRDRRLRT